MPLVMTDEARHVALILPPIVAADLRLWSAFTVIKGISLPWTDLRAETGTAQLEYPRCAAVFRCNLIERDKFNAGVSCA
jgi:hypothetical protein